jgi:hypothetical protein
MSVRVCAWCCDSWRLCCAVEALRLRAGEDRTAAGREVEKRLDALTASADLLFDVSSVPDSAELLKRGIEQLRSLGDGDSRVKSESAHSSVTAVPSPAPAVPVKPTLQPRGRGRMMPTGVNDPRLRLMETAVIDHASATTDVPPQYSSLLNTSKDRGTHLRVCCCGVGVMICYS